MVDKSVRNGRDPKMLLLESLIEKWCSIPQMKGFYLKFKFVQVTYYRNSPKVENGLFCTHKLSPSMKLLRTETGL